MVGPTNLEHIDQGTLGEGNGVFELAIVSMIKGENLIQFGKVRVVIAIKT